MSKLPKSGLLYLNDYSILAQAKSEADRFLEDVMSKVFSNIGNFIIESNSSILSKYNLLWDKWKNNTTAGQIEFKLQSSVEQTPFREKQDDIVLRVRDARSFGDGPEDSRTVTIRLYMPQGFSKGLKKLDDRFLDNAIAISKSYWSAIEKDKESAIATQPSPVKLDPESSAKSADAVAEHINQAMIAMEKFGISVIDSGKGRKADINNSSANSLLLV